MILIAAATLLAYLPAIRGGWVWDDNHHVTDNVDLLTLHGLKELWLRPGATPQYYPLTHTTFWIEHHLWSNRPLGYHLDNVLLHVANAVMVGLILRRLNARGYILAAALFALHPVQVESVAWVTERKNVLSGFFYLAALWMAMDAWKIGEQNARRFPRYWLCLLLFVLALLSKTVTSTLPAVVLLLIWWKRRRVTAREAASLVPFFALGAAMGSLTAWMERHVVGAAGPEWNFDHLQRFLIASKAICFYLGKLLWPHPLVFVYPKWPVSPDHLAVWLYPVAVILAGVLFRKSRASLAAYLFFIITLLPALGLVNVYPMRYTFVADHYQYLACIGPIALAAAWIRRPLAGVPLVLILALLTWRQSQVYADNVTLWGDVVAKDPSSDIGHVNLADALLARGQLDAASIQAELALRAGGDLVEAALEPGVIAEAHGDLQSARQTYLAASSMWFDSALPYWHLGLVDRRLGLPDDAIAQFSQAAKHLPNPAPAYEQLGEIALSQHQTAEAEDDFHRALAADPELIDAHNNLAAIALTQTADAEADSQCRAALAIDPDNAVACNNMGILLVRRGDTEQARQYFLHALLSDPGFKLAKDNLARLGR
jgi:Tfp pilus assembly protein PilF